MFIAPHPLYLFAPSGAICFLLTTNIALLTERQSFFRREL